MDGLAGKIVGVALEHPQETVAYSRLFAGQMLGIENPADPSIPWGAIAKGALAGVVVGMIVGVYVCNRYPSLGRIKQPSV